MRKRLTAALVVLTGVVGLGTALAPTAHAESSPSAFSSRLVSLINSTRTSHGLSALTVTSGTSTVAANWTAHLAGVHSLSHNPNLGSQLESHGSPDWTAYGENVGDGPASSAQALFNGYMQSPEHRANILGAAYRYLGIGVVFTGSTAWNTLDFVDQYAGATHVTHSTASSTTAAHHSARASSTPHLSAAHATHSLVTHSLVTPIRYHAPSTATRPAQHPTTRTGAVNVEAVASTLAGPSALFMPAPAAARTTPLHVPASGRTPLPILVAAALVALVALRFAHVVHTRSA